MVAASKWGAGTLICQHCVCCVPSILKSGFFQCIFSRDIFQYILPVTQLWSTLVNLFSYGIHFGSWSPGICSIKNHFAKHFINHIRPVFKLALFLFSARPQEHCGMGRNHFPNFTIHLFTATFGPASSVISCGVSHPPAFFPTPTHI